MELMEGLVWGAGACRGEACSRTNVYNIFSRDQVQSISHLQPFLVELLYLS
jgi:hypothetical protein